MSGMLSTFLNCTGIKTERSTNKKTVCLGSPLAHVLPGSSLPVPFQWPLLARPQTFVFSTCPELETVPCVQPQGSAVMLHQSHANHASRPFFVIWVGLGSKGVEVFSFRWEIRGDINNKRAWSHFGSVGSVKHLLNDYLQSTQLFVSLCWPVLELHEDTFPLLLILRSESCITSLDA